MFVYVRGMSYRLEYWYSHKKRTSDSPGAGVTGGFELAYVGSGY